MSETDKGNGERGEGLGDVPWWLKAHREAEKAGAIGAAAAVPGTCAGLCDSMRGDDVGDALRMAIHANAVGASPRDDKYTHAAHVAAMGVAAAERKARDEAPLSIGTPLFAEERGGSGYRSMMPQLGAGKSSVKSAAKPYPAPACSAFLVAQPPRDVSELYHELLYAVEQCFPGESRHETALRYIRETERRVREADCN